MNANWDFLGDIDSREAEELYAEALAVSAQLAIQKSMSRNNVSQKELAERLGVSPARVSQILSAHGRNLTLQTLGRIAHALQEDFELVSRHDIKEMRSKHSAKSTSEDEVAHFVGFVVASTPWTDQTANENKFPFKKLAA